MVEIINNFLDEFIRSDLFRYSGKTNYQAFFKALLIPGFRYMFLLRKVARLNKWSPLWYIYRILLSKYKYKYGFQIPYSTKIGKGFYISHFNGVVINKKSVIGDNCNIAHSVTIGQSNRGKHKGVPTICNKVWIGTGAVIVGNIKIGDNVLIAPNTYINFDVPSNSVVMGNPGVIIPNAKATDGYINNAVE